MADYSFWGTINSFFFVLLLLWGAKKLLEKIL